MTKPPLHPLQNLSKIAKLWQGQKYPRIAPILTIQYAFSSSWPDLSFKPYFENVARKLFSESRRPSEISESRRPSEIIFRIPPAVRNYFPNPAGRLKLFSNPAGRLKLFSNPADRLKLFSNPVGWLKLFSEPRRPSKNYLFFLFRGGLVITSKG